MVTSPLSLAIFRRCLKTELFFKLFIGSDTAYDYSMQWPFFFFIPWVCAHVQCLQDNSLIFTPNGPARWCWEFCITFFLMSSPCLISIRYFYVASVCGGFFCNISSQMPSTSLCLSSSESRSHMHRPIETRSLRMLSYNSFVRWCTCYSIYTFLNPAIAPVARAILLLISLGLLQSLSHVSRLPRYTNSAKCSIRVLLIIMIMQ